MSVLDVRDSAHIVKPWREFDARREFVGKSGAATAPFDRHFQKQRS